MTSTDKLLNIANAAAAASRLRSNSQLSADDLEEDSPITYWKVREREHVIPKERPSQGRTLLKSDLSILPKLRSRTRLPETQLSSLERTVKQDVISSCRKALQVRKYPGGNHSSQSPIRGQEEQKQEGDKTVLRESREAKVVTVEPYAGDQDAPGERLLPGLPKFFVPPRDKRYRWEEQPSYFNSIKAKALAEQKKALRHKAVLDPKQVTSFKVRKFLIFNPGDDVEVSTPESSKRP